MAGRVASRYGRAAGKSSGWERLAPGVGRRRLPGWDATVGAGRRGRVGVLVVDTGSTLREGARIRAEAARPARGRRVTHIALTHPHFDHVLGAAAFAGARGVRRGRVWTRCCAGARRGAARGRGRARAGRRTPRPRPPTCWSRPHHLVSGRAGRSTWAARAGAAGQRRPRRTRPTIWRCWCRARTGTRRSSSAATWSRSPASPRRARTRSRRRWPAALDRLLSLGGEDALYVPGHGAVVDAAFVRAQRDALAAPLRRVADTRSPAPCVSRMRHVLPDLTPPWKKPQARARGAGRPGSGGGGGHHRVLRRGDPLREDRGGPTVTLEDRFGKHRVFPMEPRGFLLEGRSVTLVRPVGARPPPRPRSARPPARSPSPAPAHGWRARGGSTWRAGTTRSWWSGSGATTCGSRAWSSSTWRASTTSRRSSRTSRPGPDARLGVLVDHLVPGSKESRIAAEVTGDARAGRRPPVHRRLGGGEAVVRRHRRLAAGAARPGLEDGRVPGAGLAGNTGAAWQRILGSVRATGTWNRRCWAGWRS